MAEKVKTNIDKDELARIVGVEEGSEFLRRKTKIIRDKKQYSVRIPTQFAELAKIDPSQDIFEFTLEPIGEKQGEFTISANLKKGKNEKGI
mgnify:CR=1 FL=1